MVIVDMDLPKQNYNKEVENYQKAIITADLIKDIKTETVNSIN